MGMAVIPAGAVLLGSYMQGRAAEEAAGYEAMMLDRNAVFAREYATTARERGLVMAGRAMESGTRMIGSARAAAGGTGFRVGGSESVGDVLATTRMMSKLDAETIKSDAMREAFQLETQATNYDMQASLTRRKGKNAMMGSLLGGLGSAGAMAYAGGLFPNFGSGAANPSGFPGTLSSGGNLG